MGEGQYEEPLVTGKVAVRQWLLQGEEKQGSDHQRLEELLHEMD